MTRRRPPAAAGVGALLLMLCAAAPAADDRGLRGSVGLTVMHDRNLFRLPDGVSPAQAGVTLGTQDGSERGDRATVPDADVDGTLALGRQRVSLRVSQQATRFQRYDAYDATDRSAALGWRWQLGNEWAGDLNADQRRRATELDDFRGAERNEVTTRGLQFNARWQPRPDRRLRLGRDRVQGRNSVPERRTADYRATLHSAEATWISGLGNEVLLRLRQGHGEYPNRSVVDSVPVDNSWRQRDAEAGLVLRPGGRTRGELRLGRGTRRHDDVPARDFSGTTGRLALAWEASAALWLDVELARDLAAVEDFDRLYAVTLRRAAGLQWVASARWQASLRWTRRELDYGGDPANALTAAPGPTEPRADRSTNLRLAVAWQPTRQWTAQLSWLRDTRRSNRDGLAYDSRAVELGTRHAF